MARPYEPGALSLVFNPVDSSAALGVGPGAAPDRPLRAEPAAPLPKQEDAAEQPKAKPKTAEASGELPIFSNWWAGAVSTDLPKWPEPPGWGDPASPTALPN